MLLTRCYLIMMFLFANQLGVGNPWFFLSIPFFDGFFINLPSFSSDVCYHGKKETIFVTTTNCVLVISPLESLMIDQMKKLKSLGIGSCRIDNANLDVEV